MPPPNTTSTLLWFSNWFSINPKKSEVVNDLIRKARAEQEQIEYVRARLKKAEESGLTDLSAEEIRQEVRNELGLNG